MPVVLWPISLAAHSFLAMVGGMIIGFVPEAFLSRLYRNTVLEPFAPAIAATALLFGYFLSRYPFRALAAKWTWMIGVAWLAFGIYDETRFWSTSWSTEKTRWQYALAMFFGPTSKCGASECLGEVFFTMPFVASAMYSLGAYLWERRTNQVN